MSKNLSSLEKNRLALNMLSVLKNQDTDYTEAKRRAIQSKLSIQKDEIDKKHHLGAYSVDKAPWN